MRQAAGRQQADRRRPGLQGSAPPGRQHEPRGGRRLHPPASGRSWPPRRWSRTWTRRCRARPRCPGSRPWGPGCAARRVPGCAGRAREATARGGALPGAAAPLPAAAANQAPPAHRVGLDEGLGHRLLRAAGVPELCRRAGDGRRGACLDMQLDTLRLSSWPLDVHRPAGCSAAFQHTFQTLGSTAAPTLLLHMVQQAATACKASDIQPTISTHPPSPHRSAGCHCL